MSGKFPMMRLWASVRKPKGCKSSRKNGSGSEGLSHAKAMVRIASDAVNLSARLRVQHLIDAKFNSQKYLFHRAKSGHLAHCPAIISNLFRGFDLRTLLDTLRIFLRRPCIGGNAHRNPHLSDGSRRSGRVRGSVRPSGPHEPRPK